MGEKVKQARDADAIRKMARELGREYYPRLERMWNDGQQAVEKRAAGQTGRNMEKQKMIEIREDLVKLRNECLGPDLDAAGALILSHAIRWMWFKTEGKPYEPERD